MIHLIGIDNGERWNIVDYIFGIYLVGVLKLNTTKIYRYLFRTIKPSLGRYRLGGEAFQVVVLTKLYIICIAVLDNTLIRIVMFM